MTDDNEEDNLIPFPSPHERAEADETYETADQLNEQDPPPLSFSLAEIRQFGLTQRVSDIINDNPGDISLPGGLLRRMDVERRLEERISEEEFAYIAQEIMVAYAVVAHATISSLIESAHKKYTNNKEEN